MRGFTLALGLLLITAVIVVLPGAEADSCNGLKNEACPGLVCLDTGSVYACVPEDECAFRSDCCPSQNVWCPEPPPDS